MPARPLSVIYPWTVAAGGLGPAAGGFPFFIDWLTKYPNWGPINYEVLLGILCVLGASSIPVAFAMYYVLARPPRMWVLGTILALDLIAFIPLMIDLDIMFAFGPLLRAVPVLVMPVLLVLSLLQQPSAPLQPAGNVSDQSA